MRKRRAAKGDRCREGNAPDHRRQLDNLPVSMGAISTVLAAGPTRLRSGFAGIATVGLLNAGGTRKKWPDNRGI
jgi:hypothetical protein